MTNKHKQEHKHAHLLRLAADNKDQMFECEDMDGDIEEVIMFPEYNWRPVKPEPKKITKGCRVKVTNNSGFHKGATGLVEFIEPCEDGKIWVLHDGADKPCWFRLEELELFE